MAFLDDVNDTKSFIGLKKEFIAVETSSQLFSDELTSVFQWITYSLLCQAVNIFGVGSNVINIICFIMQGFQDPVNVSFLGLTIADIGCLVTLMWTDLCFNPAFIAADLPFQPMEFQYLTSGMPHATFTRISSFITAIITLERCMCITAPIKVKTIVTSKRVTILIICVFFVLLASASPFYFANKLGMKFYPERNKTLIGIVSSGNKQRVEQITYAINNVCIPFISFTIITICTIILVIHLHRKTKWRKASTTSPQLDTISMRNQKVAKMVVTISVLFISCFTPLCAFFLAMSFEPELSVYGKYKNAISLFGGFGALLESINFSVNIFIYYNMSSKYRMAFQQLFGLYSKTDKIIN